MHIVFALYKYFPYGGLQRDMLAIAKEAESRGHRVSIYCREWQGERSKDYFIKALPASGRSNHVKNISFISALSRELGTINFDCLVAFDKMPQADIYYAADTCFKAKLEKERPFFNRFIPRYKSFVSIEQQLFSRQDARFLALAQAAIDEYCQYYPCEQKQFYLLPPGINRDRVNCKKEKLTVLHQELNIDKACRVLLMVGSGFATKGVDRSIEIIPDLLKANLNIHLVVVGQDKNKKYLKLASRLNVRDKVSFLGGRDDVSALLKSADLLLHPARRENTGTVLLEAAVAGLPVICSEVCGYSHYIKENNLGWVINQPFISSEFLEATQKLLEDKSLYEKNRECCWSFSDKPEIYSLSKVAVDEIETCRQ